MENCTIKRLHFVIVALLVSSNALKNINKEFVGVVFSPHVKSTGNVWDWNNYTPSEVETMLEIISKNFRNISTYGVGAIKAGVSRWDSGEAVGYTGIVAAKLNSKLNKTAISSCIAVWRHDDASLLNTEIEKAISIAKEANEIHPGSVWGITFSSNYAIDENTADQVVEMIEMGRKRADEKQLLNVKSGVRLDNCDALINSKTYSTFLNNIFRKSDYVLCIIFTPTSLGRQGVPTAVDYLTNLFLQIKQEAKKVNEDIHVIFESGWPSKGTDRHLLLTSIHNLEEFWDLMADSAAKNKLHLNLFEAFDAPWKSTISASKFVYNGPCGAEGHFGWWRRINDSITDSSAYVEKITETQTPLCEDMPNVKPIAKSYQTLMEISTGIVLFFVAALVIYFWHRKSTIKKVEVLTEEIITEFENGVVVADEESETNIEIALRLPYDRKYEKERKQFTIGEYTSQVLGRGQFGIVYKGIILEGELEAAFKTTKNNCSTENILNLLKEIKLMIYIGNHPNIVELLGACTSDILEGNRVLIAMEYCSKGSLEKVLRAMALKFAGIYYVNVDECEFSSDYSNLEKYVNNIRLPEKLSIINAERECKLMEKLLQWSYDIAKGMEHLNSKKVVHADLATRNVLVSKNGVAKITDFGLSRKMYAYEKYVKKNTEPLPWRWMAIESLQRLYFSQASDVWSFGVTLWEIFSLGEIPYPGLNWEIGFLSKLKDGMRLEKPTHATDEIYQNMRNCWEASLQERPTFGDLVKFFEIIIKKTKEKYELVDISSLE